MTSPEFDITVPHPARVYDYLLGGKDNYAADRQAAGEIVKVAPELAASAKANRAFLGRAVRFLARQHGIWQFLDIGTGIPAAGNTHEVAQAIAPESRVVYVDNDPVVLAHARALLIGDPAGATACHEADLRDPEAILDAAAQVLDFSKPAALLLVAILHFIPDDENPAGLVAAYRDALAPGSFLVLSHGTGDFHPPEVADTAAKVYGRGPASLTLRPREAVEKFFDGFTLAEPGVVQVPAWRPDAPGDGLGRIGVYAGAGAKK